jgi:hypothetical protein
MKKIYLAQMMWCEAQEPICAGANKKRVAREAYRILKERYGDEHVSRGMAMCHAPITHNDIEVREIPLVE